MTLSNIFSLVGNCPTLLWHQYGLGAGCQIPSFQALLANFTVDGITSHHNASIRLRTVSVGLTQAKLSTLFDTAYPHFPPYTFLLRVSPKPALYHHRLFAGVTRGSSSLVRGRMELCMVQASKPFRSLELSVLLYDLTLDGPHVIGVVETWIAALRCS